MPRQSLYLCVFYGLIATVALVATWSQNLAYFLGAPDPGGLMAFLGDTRVNPASRSITIDIGLFALAGSAFMILEARRLGMRFVWAYILLGFLVAISVTFPLFMIARERHLIWRDGQDAVGPMRAIDGLGIAVTAAAVAGLSAHVLGG